MTAPHSPIALAVLLSATGCATTTLDLRVADPARVTVTSGGKEVLPAERGERTEVLRDGTFAPEKDARATYAVRAHRSADGELAFRWETKVPLSNGEHQVVMHPDGTFASMEEVVARIEPESLKLPTLHIESCAQLTQVSRAAGYRATEWTCTPGAAVTGVSVPFALDTPWDNVVELRDHREVNTVGTIGVAVLGLATIAGGAALAILPKRSASGVIGGGALMLGGVLLDLVAVLDLALPSTDRLVRPSRDRYP